MLGTSLLVPQAVRVIAAPASAMNTVTRKAKTEEENPLMPEIMHLIKIHATQERVFQALSTPEGIRHWRITRGTPQGRFCAAKHKAWPNWRVQTGIVCDFYPWLPMRCDIL
jgi:hypothetical protein